MTHLQNAPDLEQLAGEIANQIFEKLRLKQPPASPWMTPEDAAHYLSLSRRGLEDMRAREGGPKFHKASDRVIRYHVRDLDAWLLSDGAANG